MAMAEVGEKREGRRATSAAEVAADDEKAQQGLVSVTWSWNKDDVSEGSRKKEYFIYLESVPQFVLVLLSVTYSLYLYF